MYIINVYNCILCILCRYSTILISILIFGIRIVNDKILFKKTHVHCLIYILDENCYVGAACLFQMLYV